MTDSFQPRIEMVMDQAPRPVFVAVLAPKLWKKPVPASIQNRPLSEEFQAVFKIYQAHYKRYGGRFARGASCFIGFRYYRSPDEVVVFDNDGFVINRGDGASLRTQTALKLKGGGRVDGLFGGKSNPPFSQGG